MSGSSPGAPLALLGVETPSRPFLAPFPAPLSGANLAPSEADPAPLKLCRILLELRLLFGALLALELYWVSWSGGSPWGDSSLGAALAPSMGAELDLCWEIGHIYVNSI